VFHVDRLSPWKGNKVNGVNPQPPEPIKIDEEEEYEVDGVLDSQFYCHQLQYLVSFKGYDTGHNMWLPHFNVHAPELIKWFHRMHPNAPQRLSTTLFWTLPWSMVENVTLASTDLEWESGCRPVMVTRGVYKRK
jgi:hypothetical protein